MESQRNDEDLNNLKYDKTAVSLAAKDVFKDVVDDYTNKSIIVSRFYELIERFNLLHDLNEHLRFVAEESKVLEWIIEALATFATVDMIGYDPLGYTVAEHDLYKKAEFTETPFFKEMNNLLELYKETLQKEIQDRHSFVQRIITGILGQVCKRLFSMFKKF